MCTLVCVHLWRKLECLSTLRMLRPSSILYPNPATLPMVYYHSPGPLSFPLRTPSLIPPTPTSTPPTPNNTTRLNLTPPPPLRQPLHNQTTTTWPRSLQPLLHHLHHHPPQPLVIFILIILPRYNTRIISDLLRRGALRARYGVGFVREQARGWERGRR